MGELLKSISQNPDLIAEFDRRADRGSPRRTRSVVRCDQGRRSTSRIR